MRIVMLGAPGSGKGTQTKMLEAEFGAPQLSTGDLLRAAVAAGSDVGKRAKAAMDAGELVSDEIVLALIREKITGPQALDDFVLDGFPRNLAQAQELDALLAEVGKPLEKVALIDVDPGVLWQRISGRRSCSQCGAVFNVYTAPPRVEGVCDYCGGALYQREDDNEQTVENRLRTYAEQTAPLSEFYRGKGLLVRVDGEAEPEVVFQRLLSALGDLAGRAGRA